MAKRRVLAVPSSADLEKMEADFRREPAPVRPGVAPIAQVAAEAAAVFDPRSADERAEAVRDRAVASAFREARTKGLVMVELPIEEIEADALVRDRVVIDAEELEELKASIAKTGLRLPVEVFEQMPGAARPYGLLSGYRRLMAVRALWDLTHEPRYATIRAVVREPEAMGGAFAAMIEENEIRASLSQFERGRIAVIAAQQGAFANPEAAVDALFPVASKAKRSKIRSFALIFEELGDMLKFPDLLREKDGLRIAQALRDGAEARLRDGLAEADPADPAAELAALERILDEIDSPAPDPRKGGRPRRAAGPAAETSAGFTVVAEQDARGWALRIGGRRKVDRGLMESLVREVSRLLEKP